MNLSRAIILAILVTSLSCRESTTTPTEPKTKAPVSKTAVSPETEIATEDEPSEPDVPELPTFETSSVPVRPGLKQLSDCDEYRTYLTSAMINFHSRRRFPDQFSDPIVASTQPKHVNEPVAWGRDGDWVIYELGSNLQLLNTKTAKVQIVYNEMFGYPAIQSTRGGDVYFGRSSDLITSRLTRFARPTQRVRGSDGIMYKQYRSSGLELYRRVGDKLRHRNIMRSEGELLGVHVSDAKMATIVTFGEPHLDTPTAQKGRRAAENAESIESLASEINKITIPKKAKPSGRPQYGWSKNPKGGRTPGDHSETACDDFWVPSDPAVESHRLLVVSTFDPEKPKFVSSFAVALGDNFQYALSDDRLYVVRPMRGGERGESIEAPVSAVNIFSIGDAPKLLSSAIVDGVPVEINVWKTGGILTTTRWEESETLIYRLTKTGVSKTPTRHEAGIRVAKTQGRRSELASELVLKWDVLIDVGDRILSIKVDDEQMIVGLHDSDGETILEARARADLEIVKWDRDNILVDDGVAVIAAQIVDDEGEDYPAMLINFGEEKITLKPFEIPKESIPVALDDGVLTIVNPTGALWIALSDGSIQRKVSWADFKPETGGRPTKASK